MKSTYHTIRIDGIPCRVPNVIDRSTSEYYVSYNNYDKKIYGCDTTAIVIYKTSAFLILNGDHRGNISGMSLAEACDYFHENADKKNHMSDDHQSDVLRRVDGKWQMIRVPE